MNAKTFRAMRRAARQIYAAQPNRAGRSLVVIGTKVKEFPTGGTNADGSPATVKLQVHTLGNHPDSYRGIYRKMKREARQATR